MAPQNQSVLLLSLGRFSKIFKVNNLLLNMTFGGGFSGLSGYLIDK